MVLTDAVPANTTLLTATTTAGTVVRVAPVTANIGTLAVGATATVTITVQVNAGTPAGTAITNQGTVNATGVRPRAVECRSRPSSSHRPACRR